MRCLEVYEDTYKKQAQGIAFCPYRVCPIGAHSDHNLGKITGFAIDKGINIAYGKKENGVIELTSLDFDKRCQWHVSSVPSKQSDWADYLRGATIYLKELYPLQYGLSGVIEGSLPIGGLSSSAAVIISFLEALCKVNNIVLTKQEMIDVAYKAELFYVGVSVGKLDQSCEVLSKENHLLYLDTKDNSYELIKKPENMKDFDILVFYSGLEHSLVSSKYNMRVDELKAAAYCLMAYGGINYGKFNEAVCRDIPYDVYEKYLDKLPENFALRAKHWFSEFKRVEEGAQAFKNGDIEEYGRLSFESGYSSIHNWQTGAIEQIKLYEIMTNTKGIYGGRFSGAGFKGCCIAIADPNYREEIITNVSKEYLKAFPNMEEKYHAYVCKSADGVSLWNV